MTAAAPTNGISAAVLAALIFGSVCAATGTFLLKVGATGHVQLIEFLNMRLIGGLVLYGLGSACWIFGMSRAPLTVVYPFTAMTFVLVIAAGYLFLGERVTFAGVGGSALILSGIGFIIWGNA